MTLIILTLFLSAMLGYGLYLSVGALTTPAASLQAEFDRIARTADDDDLVTSLAERFGRMSGDVPLADLQVLGWSKRYWYQRRILFTAIGLIIGCVLALVLRLFVDFPLILVVPILGVLIAGIGILTADSDRSTKADLARDEIRLALTHFLEITSIMLAGGAGAETALEEAVIRGHGPGFRLFSREIAKAKEDPTMSAFSALRDLGQRLAVRELTEFGNVMILSSENAATVRQALDDKAALIIFRDHEKRKSDALARNVAMSIPVVGMAGGFILWLVYAALAGLANL